MDNEYQPEELTNLRYMNEERTVITADFVDDPNGSVVIEPGMAEWDKVLAGDFGAIASYAPLEGGESPIEEYRRKLYCDRLQAKAVLYEYGMLDQVQALVEQADFVVQLAWNEAPKFTRNSAVIQTLQHLMKWPDGSDVTDEDLDEMFELARTISF